MKKDDNLKNDLDTVLSKLTSAQRNRALSSIPLSEGDVIKFTGETVISSFTNDKGEVINYGAFVTNKGNLPFSTIARSGNGLNLVARTYEGAIKEFAARINDNYSLKVVKVHAVPSSFGNGKYHVYIFKESNEC